MKNPRILVSAGNFGWGAAGKLASVANLLTGIDLLLVDTHLGLPVLDGLNIPVVGPGGTPEEFRHIVDQYRPRALASFGAPEVAQQAGEIGLYSIFIDSLPYLWTAEDNVPMNADVYCAQQCLSVPVEAQSVLSNISNLTWVEAIVPPRATRFGGNGVLVSVGGLESPISRTSPEAYLVAALGPLFRALEQEGFTDVRVVGNLTPERVRLIQALAGRSIQAGVLSHAEFIQAMSRCDILVTSPGSTTVLQAASSGVPCLVLPPQNLSQMMNLKFLGLDCCPGIVSASWLEDALTYSAVEKLRPLGENAVVSYIYECITRLASQPNSTERLREAYRQALRAILNGGSPTLPSWLGENGAEQVAHIISRFR